MPTPISTVENMTKHLTNEAKAEIRQWCGCEAVGADD